MSKLIIFDWDGVIADSCSSYLDFYRFTTEHFGKEFPIKTVEDYRDWYDSAWENNFINLGFSKEEFAQVRDFQLAHINYEEIPLFPGIKTTLEKLSGNFTLAIASTTHSHHIKKKLSAEKMESLFSFISGGEGGTSDKRIIISRVPDTLQIPYNDSLMLGDTVMDIISAKEVGIRCVGTAYGWNSARRLKEANPDYLLNSPDEILPLIEEVFPL